MRKRSKKLALYRETVRNLMPEELNRVGGAAGTYEIVTTCACTNGCNDGGGGGGDTGGCDGATYEIITTCAC